jgi:hypothetical protein
MRREGHPIPARAIRARAIRSIVGSAVLAAALAGVPAPSASAAVTHDDTVWAFGAATFRGSTQGFGLVHRVVGMATTANGAGYWLVAEDGAVFSFNAPFYGSISGWPLRAPVVGITATTTGRGYWIVTADGAVFAMGDARSYGQMYGTPMNAPVRALVPGPKSKGYWLLGTDGGVFSFGSARFRGSTGGKPLNAPVVGMASTPSGNGYWLVGMDGGVFSFGDARFRGSMGGKPLNAPVVGIARDGAGTGYWLAGADGGVFTFGTARFKGSAAGMLPAGRQVVQIAGMPAGNGYRLLAIANVPDVALQGPGAQGLAVAYLQQRLLALGYWLPGVDGFYSGLTQQAVWAFQKWHRLPRTGVVDPATQAAFRTAQRPLSRSTSGYVVEIVKPRQVILIAHNGSTRWVFNTSTGNDIPYVENGQRGDAHTPEGIFTLIRQVNAADHGPLGVLWRPKYFTWQGHAIHGSNSVPPFPASHGCARVTNEAMNWMWDHNVLPLGTLVWVYS